MSTATKFVDTETPIEKQLDELLTFADEVKFALFTTKRDDSQLVTRPMALVKRVNKVDFYMITSKESHKIEELEANPNVNLGLFRNSDYSWASISGKATVEDNRALVHELHSFFMRPFFEDKGDGVHDGGKDDPRIILIKFETHSAQYQKQNNTLVQAFELAKSAVTGGAAQLGVLRIIPADVVSKARG